MLLTDKEFLEAELQMGITPGNPDFRNLAKATVAAIEAEITFKTVLDYGAGVGVYSAAFKKAGYDCYSYEIWEAHREFMRKYYTGEDALQIIEQPMTTDLMAFIEVAEHMTDQELHDLFQSIRPSWILFSSTSNKTAWDDKWGHINIKMPLEWIDLFQSFGYLFIKKLHRPTAWTMLFRIEQYKPNPFITL